MKTWLVIGGGNGGQATAAHLGIQGHQVRLHDIDQTTVDTINAKGGIEAVGVVSGFGPIQFATTDLKKALDGVDSIIISVPSFAHGPIAKAIAPLLKTGQNVLLHPATLLGSLVFQHELDACGNDAEIIWGEAISLVYAARLIEAGKVNILGIKDVLPYAVFPSCKSEEFTAEFRQAIPQLTQLRAHVLAGALENIGCVVHPMPTILNTGLVESDRDWLYYYDGITPAVSRAMEAIDKERVAIGAALGVELDSALQVYQSIYPVSGNNLREVMHQVTAYAGVSGHHDIGSRYLTEEVPFALMPIISLAKRLGVDTPLMEATVAYAKAMLGDDLVKNARTLASVGLEDISQEELMHYLTYGTKN